MVFYLSAVQSTRQTALTQPVSLIWHVSARRQPTPSAAQLATAVHV